MSKETHLQDSAFEEIWKKMDEIEPLTPIVKDSMRAYKEAAASDSYMFGEYDGYQAYKGDEQSLFFYKYFHMDTE